MVHWHHIRITALTCCITITPQNPIHPKSRITTAPLSETELECPFQLHRKEHRANQSGVSVIPPVGFVVMTSVQAHRTWLWVSWIICCWRCKLFCCNGSTIFIRSATPNPSSRRTMILLGETSRPSQQWCPKNHTCATFQKFEASDKARVSLDKLCRALSLMADTRMFLFTSYKET